MDRDRATSGWVDATARRPARTLGKVLRFAASGAFACLFAQLGLAYWSGKITSRLWSIDAPSGSVRWIEIHNLDSAKADGLYHVEVLERRSVDPPWRFTSLAPHMAVMEQALRASALAPFKRGSVNPGAYEDAFARWKIAAANHHAFVCTTTIIACLAMQSP